MKPLKIGITGVRGIVGQTFTPELVVQFAQAFGSYLDGGRILICRDTRPSGPMIRSAVIAGLLAGSMSMALESERRRGVAATSGGLAETDEPARQCERCRRVHSSATHLCGCGSRTSRLLTLRESS